MMRRFFGHFVPAKLACGLVLFAGGCDRSHFPDHTGGSLPRVEMTQATGDLEPVSVFRLPIGSEESLDTLVGRWVGQSPDGAEVVAFEFEPNGRVSWQLTSADGVTSRLTAKYVRDVGSEGGLDFFDFVHPAFAGVRFRGLLKFESPNVVHLDGRFQSAVSPIVRPTELGPLAVRLVRTPAAGR